MIGIGLEYLSEYLDDPHPDFVSSSRSASRPVRFPTRPALLGQGNDENPVSVFRGLRILLDETQFGSLDATERRQAKAVPFPSQRADPFVPGAVDEPEEFAPTKARPGQRDELDPRTLDQRIAEAFDLPTFAVPILDDDGLAFQCRRLDLANDSLSSGARKITSGTPGARTAAIPRRAGP